MESSEGKFTWMIRVIFEASSASRSDRVLERGIKKKAPERGGTGEVEENFFGKKLISAILIH